MNHGILRRASGGAAVALMLFACHAFAGPKAAAPAPKPAPTAKNAAAKQTATAPAATAQPVLAELSVPGEAQRGLGSIFMPHMAVAAPAKFCTTEGKVARTGMAIHVDVGAMRGVLSTDRSRSAEVDFTYRGPSKDTQPLADGEIRRQIGVKLKAQDSCNVVYAMWHIAPDTGVFVLVKQNPGKSTHEACKDGGYITPSPTQTRPVAAVAVGAPHTLRADLDGQRLRVTADGALAWEGTLPASVLQMDGPPGVRSDNGTFDFSVHVPNGATSAPACP